jgi:hypothetical protein
VSLKINNETNSDKSHYAFPAFIKLSAAPTFEIVPSRMMRA